MQISGYQILKEASFGVSQICGTQEYNPQIKYIRSKFVIAVSVPDGELLYSTISGEVIFVKDSSNALEYLIKHWFYVADNFDEIDFVSKVRKMMKTLRKITNSGLNTYEIVTTTSCNARCYYCYQHNFKRLTMGSDVADKVIDFIRVNYNGKAIRFKWFGGEPLMNEKIITRITSSIKGLGIQYYSSMISNGYLFTDDIISQAKKIWNLRSVIITLDGTKNVYNKTKNYISDFNNAYDVVISNIEKLIRAEILITIRLNIEKRNIQDISRLIDDLVNKYKGNKYVKFMLRPLNNTEDNLSIESPEKERISVLSSISRFRDQIFNAGFDIECEKLTGITGCSCIADSGTYILIKPNGALAYCSIDFDKKIFGNVFKNNSEVVYPDLDYFRIEKAAICYSCPLFPLCSPSSICPSCIKSFCNPRQKIYNINEYKFSMKLLYRKKYETEKYL